MSKYFTKYCDPFCPKHGAPPNTPQPSDDWLDIILRTVAKDNDPCLPSAKAAIIQHIQEELDNYVQDLKDAFRDYNKQYPDANINDFIGLLVGVRNQPHRVIALKPPSGDKPKDQSHE